MPKAVIVAPPTARTLTDHRADGSALRMVLYLVSVQPLGQLRLDYGLSVRAEGEPRSQEGRTWPLHLPGSSWQSPQVFWLNTIREQSGDLPRVTPLVANY